MKKMICQAAMAAALVSLVGCGLKGPLYFPSDKQPANAQQSASQQGAAQTSTDETAGRQVSQ